MAASMSSPLAAKLACGSYRGSRNRYAIPTAAWKTLRVSHSSHRPDDNGGRLAHHVRGLYPRRPWAWQVQLA